MTSDYLDRLAQFAVEFSLDRAPASVISDATTQLLDTVGVIVGGSAAKPVRALAARRAQPVQTGRARGIGLPGWFRPTDAALLHGAAATWYDFDAGHRFSGGHPPAHVVPAVLAVADAEGATGADVVAAVIVGCEIACRIGVALGPRPATHHPHGSWPVLGAVAAVGRILKATPGELRTAFEVASTLTLVTSWQTAFVGANVRNLYAGLGAELATRAIDLVRVGFVGEPDGVGVVFGSILTPSINRRRAIIELGERWEFQRTYLKPYAFARFGHAAIDAIRKIQSATPFSADEVVAVEIASGALASKMRNPRPTTDLAARFSLPWAVGAWLVRGSCDIADFTEEALTDTLVAAVAARVTVREDPDWEALNPQWRGATVRVALRDGRVLVGEVNQTLGDPERPLSPADVRDKFLRQVAPVLGVDRARRAADALVSLISAADCRATLALLHPGAESA